jgi:hypothetical protein
MKFTVRKRQYPNGRTYWIVMRGKTQLLVNNAHRECRYISKNIAQAAADKINREMAEEAATQ